MQAVFNDPNVIYLALVVGLWAAVTAAYIPGTGVPEVISAVLLVGAFAMLGNQATNWLAVILIAGGAITFLVMPFITRRFRNAAYLGIIAQAIGGLFIFPNGVSWVVWAASVVAPLLYHLFILMPILKTAREHVPQDTPSQANPGTFGFVVKDFHKQGSRYVGIVQVGGEQWTGFAHELLKHGEDIVVVERNGLQVLVETAKPKGTKAPKTPAQ